MKKLIFIFCAVLLLACQDVEKVPKPKNLIPEDKMVEVLTDFALFNAARSYNLRQLQQTGVNPAEFIYTKHGIDSLQFLKSNEYYISNIEEYQQIFDSVKLELEALKTHHDSILKEYRKQMESVKGKKIWTGGDLDSLNFKSSNFFNNVSGSPIRTSKKEN
ncbi:MAG TPA: DUF4296 domain-containing protein [Salinimicrobium sp.]|nr:DUF4296 domain-containing protein [Salinimicrobium sp.]